MAEKKKYRQVRVKAFESPAEFYSLFNDYEAYNMQDTLIKREAVKSGEQAGRIIDVEVNQPLTWAGFETYLQKEGTIMFTTDYRTNKENRYSDYADVISACEARIYHSKYGGAATNLLNANIISRDLGLIDKVENKVVMEQPIFNI
ncbi:terminase small subunit [Elizabethkingia phage TCUEAP1]|nr:terminase small subunit [Elizabethkingia phage TCUEAP1]